MSRREKSSARGRHARSVTSPVAALLLGLVLLAGPAAAYASGAGDHAHHRSSGDAVALVLLGAAGLVVAAATRPGRTAIALALALIGGVFGLEAAGPPRHPPPRPPP